LAKDAIHILRRGGIPPSQISLVGKGFRSNSDIAMDIPFNDDSVRDATLGAGFGAILGVLGGAVAAIATGGGVVFLIGPLAAGMTGAVAGAFLAGLGGWGVHHERITHFETLVSQGKSLIVAYGNPLQIIDADRILKETDPIELHVFAKSGAESPEVNPQEHRGA
jgi:hypothetical protein